MTEDPRSPTLSIGQAAFRLRKSWHATYRLVLVGAITATNTGGKWAVDEASVESYRQQNGGAPQAA